MARSEPGGVRVQMVDVARRAGVSAATVSRALSGNSMIPEATRLRIEEVARLLDYRVNQSAANLRRGQPNSVGVVVMTDSEQPISDPFILGMIGHIADALNKRGLNLLLTQLRRDHKSGMQALVDGGQVRGLLVIGQAKYHLQLNELEQAGVPIVVWGAVLPDALYSVVGGDNLEGGYLATLHLLQAGARHIAFLGDVKYPEVKLRHSGYVRALRDFGLKPDKQLASNALFSARDVAGAIDSWLDAGVAFDAVFATSDVAAAHTIAALATRGLRVPRQVRVVGYDDVPLSAHIHPSLTTIRQPINLAAEAMIDLLHEKLAGNASRSLVLPTDLVERKSSR
jgi:DNA-binding LacI/PurR family transcriptional regulator